MLISFRLDITRALTKAIHALRAGRYQSRLEAHERVKDMYSWSDVAERTENVYNRVINNPHRSTYDRLERLISKTGPNDFGLGPVFGVILVIIIAVEHMFLWVLELIWPINLSTLGEVECWDHEKFVKVSYMFFHHGEMTDPTTTGGRKREGSWTNLKQRETSRTLRIPRIKIPAFVYTKSFA